MKPKGLEPLRPGAIRLKGIVSAVPPRLHTCPLVLSVHDRRSFSGHGGLQTVIVFDDPRVADKRLRTNVFLLYYYKLGRDSKLSLRANHLIRGRRFAKIFASFLCR